MTTSRPSLRVRKVWPAVKPEHFARSSWGSWPFVRPRQWSLTHTLKATGIEVYEIWWNHERQAHLIEVFRVADGGLNLISFAWIGWKGQFNFKQSCFQTPKLAGGVSAYVFQYSCPSSAIKEDGSKIRDDGTKNDHQHFWFLWAIHQIGESRREQPEGLFADPPNKITEWTCMNEISSASSFLYLASRYISPASDRQICLGNPVLPVWHVFQTLCLYDCQTKHQQS